MVAIAVEILAVRYFLFPVVEAYGYGKYDCEYDDREHEYYENFSHGLL